ATDPVLGEVLPSPLRARGPRADPLPPAAWQRRENAAARARRFRRYAARDCAQPLAPRRDVAGGAHVDAAPAHRCPGVVRLSRARRAPRYGGRRSPSRRPARCAAAARTDSPWPSSALSGSESGAAAIATSSRGLSSRPVRTRARRDRGGGARMKTPPLLLTRARTRSNQRPPSCPAVQA